VSGIVLIAPPNRALVPRTKTIRLV
jgi:hypothetical protein